jgi:hypothetical protein
MIPLDLTRVSFAHDQSLRWDDRGIHPANDLPLCTMAKRWIHGSTELARTPNIFPKMFMETP